MMRNSHQRAVMLLDAIFASAFAAALGAGVYMGLIRHDSTAAEIHDLHAAVGQSRDELITLRMERDRVRTLLAKRQSEMSKSGTLPTDVPVEQYFQDLSRLASEHHLQIIRQNPLSPRSYPGLLEQRYAFEVSGAMTDLMLFFKALEDIDFWADISYIKIIDGRSRAEGDPDDRLATLAISIFSALADGGAGSG